MLVSTNAFLQSIKDNNKQTIDQTVQKVAPASAAKEAHEALNKPQTPILQQQTQEKTVQSTITQTLENLVKQGASKETILNSLKNSAVFANLGSVSNDLKSLMNLVKTDPVLSKFETVLSQFMKNIENLDPENLATQIKNSGVFLEAKLANVTTPNALPKQVLDLLKNISLELSKLDSNIAKPLQTQIEQLLQQSTKIQTPAALQEALQKISSALKNIIQNQQSPVTTQLQTLTNQLQNITKDAVLIESKLQNNIQIEPLIQKNITVEIKNVLENLKQTIQNMPDLKNGAMMNKIIDHLLSQPLMLNPQNPPLNNPLTLHESLGKINETLKQIVQTTNLPIENKLNIEQSVKTIENVLTQLMNAKPNEKLPLLSQIKGQLEQIMQNIEPKNPLQSKIEQVINNQLPLNTLKALEQTLQQNINISNSGYVQNNNSNIMQISQQINNIAEQIQNPTLQNIKTVQDSLQQLVQNMKDIPNAPQISKAVVELLGQAKPMLIENSFNQNINNLLSLLKNEIVANQPEQVTQQLKPMLQKLESMSQPNVLQQIFNDSNPVNTKQMLQQDMKAVLLQMQEEIKNIDTPQAKEVYRQIEKLVGQIEYFQVLSYASNTQNTFMPFVWDMMEEGELSFKKLKDERFFVQINLKLKELGKVDMMVILHDKNQLDISIFAQRKIFKEMVQATLPKLKTAIHSVGLVPFQIRLLDMKEDESVKKETNAFVQQEQIGMGINIKV